MKELDIITKISQSDKRDKLRLYRSGLELGVVCQLNDQLSGRNLNRIKVFSNEDEMEEFFTLYELSDTVKLDNYTNQRPEIYFFDEKGAPINFQEIIREREKERVDRYNDIISVISAYKKQDDLANSTDTTIEDNKALVQNLKKALNDKLSLFDNKINNLFIEPKIGLPQITNTEKNEKAASNSDNVLNLIKKITNNNPSSFPKEQDYKQGARMPFDEESFINTMFQELENLQADKNNILKGLAKQDLEQQIKLLLTQINYVDSVTNNKFRFLFSSKAKVQKALEDLDNVKTLSKEEALEKTNKMSKTTKEKYRIVNAARQSGEYTISEILKLLNGLSDLENTEEIKQYVEEFVKEKSDKKPKINENFPKTRQETIEDLKKQYESLSEDEKNAILLYQSDLGQIMNEFIRTEKLPEEQAINLEENEKIKDCYAKIKEALELENNGTIKEQCFKGIKFDSLEEFIKSVKEVAEAFKKTHGRIKLRNDISLYGGGETATLLSEQAGQYVPTLTELDGKISEKVTNTFSIKAGTPVLYAPNQINIDTDKNITIMDSENPILVNGLDKRLEKKSETRISKYGIRLGTGEKASPFGAGIMYKPNFLEEKEGVWVHIFEIEPERNKNLEVPTK